MRFLVIFILGFYGFAGCQSPESTQSQQPTTSLDGLKTFGTMGKEMQVLKKDQETELFSYEGNGCLTHMWFGGSFKNVEYTNIRIYVDGEDNLKEGFVVDGKESAYSLRHELILQPGDQLTFEPYEKHWFQAGPRGAVLYSFSTTVRDGLDGFTDPAIQRLTIVEDD